MSKKYKDHYLPVEVIIAATQGEAISATNVSRQFMTKGGLCTTG